MGLRIAHLPMYTVRKLAYCTSWAWVRRWVVPFVKAHEDVFAYICVPADGHPDNAEVIAAQAHPRIKFVPVPMFEKTWDNMMFVPDEVRRLFNTMDGVYHVDIMMTDRIMSIPYLRNVLTTNKNDNHGLSIVGSVQFFVSLERYTSGLPAHFDRAFGAGLVEADGVMVSNAGLIKMGMLVAKRGASSMMASRVMLKMKPWLYNLNMDVLKQLSVTTPKSKIETTIIWGWGFNALTHPDEILDIHARLIRSGRQVHSVVCSSSLGAIVSHRQIMDPDMKSVMETHFRFPQDEYFRVAAGAHIFVEGVTEGMEINPSGWELQILGAVGVFIVKKEARKHLAYPGYPYLVETFAEAEAAVRFLADNYWTDEVQGVIELQRRYIRETFLDIDVMQCAYDWFNDMLAEKQRTMLGIGRLRETMRKAVGHVTSITWAEMAERLSKMIEVPRYHPDTMTRGTNIIRRLDFRKAMFDLGYYDDCQFEQPVFHRRDLVDVNRVGDELEIEQDV